MHDHLNICRKCLTKSKSLHDNYPKESNTRGTYLNIIKAIFEKPIVNVILNGRKHEAIPLKPGMTENCSLSIFLFHGNTRGKRRKQNAYK